MQEEKRNRLLRRVDWRFLLSDPEPKSILCLAEDLAEPLALISRVRQSTAEVESGPGFDLVVTRDPSQRTLATALGALCSEGSIYAEWHDTVSGGWKEIASRLRLAGFEDVACFWPRPDPLQKPTTVWIPLEAREALEYYRTRRIPTRCPARLAGRVVRWIQWTLRPRWPVSAIARKPAVSAISSRGQTEPLTEIIRANWSDWGFGSTPRRIVRLQRASPGRSSGKVVTFFFGAGDAEPQLVAKMARTRESAAGLQQEATVLRALAARPGRVPGIPRVLLSRPDGTVIETALKGLPLSGFIDRRTYPMLAMKATDWLGNLAGPDDGGRLQQSGFVDCLLEDFTFRFGSVLDDGLVREAEQLLSHLPPLRSVCEQRDFSPWNILLTPDEEFSVLDWESSELQGIPALDLIYFLTYLALYFDRALRDGRHLESFRRTLGPASFTGEVTRASLTSYAERTGLPDGAVRSLRVLAWLLHSRSEYRHLVEDCGGFPDPERLRRSFFLGLFKEEIECSQAVSG